MFSTDLYINNIEKKMKRKERIGTYYFGVVFGITLLFISLFRIIIDMNIKNDLIYILLLILSLLDFFIILLFPSKMKYYKNIVLFLGKIIGRVLISLMLIIVYLIWFVPATVICKINKKDSNTTFKNKDKSIVRKLKRNFMSQIKNILSYFCSNENWYLIPVLIIFLLIGIVLFFAQSPAITPLIYPLI